MLLPGFFSRLIKITFNKVLCGKYLKRLHNNILRPQNKPIYDSNLLLKNREFPSTRAFLQQTNTVNFGYQRSAGTSLISLL